MPSSQPNPLAGFNTLPELFLRAIEKHPKPDAFLYKSGGSYRSMSSDEALQKVAALARALDRLVEPAALVRRATQRVGVKRRIEVLARDAGSSQRRRQPLAGRRVT